MLVQEIMTLNPKSLSAKNTLQDAAQLMHTNAFSCIPVVADGVGIGLLTERDVVRLLASAHNSSTLSELCNTPLNKCVQPNPVSLQESTSLLEALVIARRHKARHLLVTDTQDKLVGIVTQSDLTAAYEEILQHQQELQVRNYTLERMSYEDDLMEIGNRRAMEKDLELADSMLSRYGHHYAVALIDVDYFKKYNDTYGHLSGDAVLFKLAAALKVNVRSSDQLYRYGGEELLLLIHDADQSNLEQIGEKLRNAIIELNIPHCESPLQQLTVSIGMARATNADWHEVVSNADEALYAAKERGRNRIMVSSANKRSLAATG